MVHNSTNINNRNNYLPSQII